MAKIGRPAKYKPEYAEQAFQCCSVFGADDVKLAEYFKTSVATIYNWKNKNPEFLEALKKGKEFYDTQGVENALLKRALGYTLTLVKQKTTKDGDVVDCDEEVHVAPDVTAQIFWLKNRQPERWRDKQEIEHSGNVTVETGIRRPSDAEN